MLAVLNICSKEELNESSGVEDDTRIIPRIPLSPNELAQYGGLFKYYILAAQQIPALRYINQLISIASLHAFCVENRRRHWIWTTVGSDQDRMSLRHEVIKFVKIFANSEMRMYSAFPLSEIS
jgi:hypothetical protein